MVLSAGNRIVEIKAKNLKVSGSLPIEEQDMGGFGSGTDSVNAGNKPKTLSVNGLFPYTEVEDVQQLVAIAEAVDEDGSRVVYDIVDRTAKAMNIRQVIFSGPMSLNQDDQLQVWAISFALQEKRSVAEQIDERQSPVEISATTAEGTTVSTSGSDNAKLAEVAK